MRKKIAIIHGQMVIGGAERVLVNMLHHLDYDHYDVYLFLDKPVEKDEDGLEHLIDRRVHISYWGDMTFSILSPFIHPDRFDCAIAYQGLNLIHLQHLNRRIKAERRIAWIHGDCRYECSDEERIRCYTREYARLDRIFCVSRGVEDIFTNVFPKVCHLTAVHYNLLDEEEIKRKSTIDVDDPLADGLSILSLGRMSKEKGHILIPLAARMLKEKGIRFHWYIVGDGDCRIQVEREIKKQHVEDCVSIKGYRQNPYPYIQQCRLFVLPSISEGYCTVTLEALLLHKAVVATPVCGINEQIEDGYTGLICKDKTSEALFEAICRMVTDRQLTDFINGNVRRRKFNNISELQKLYGFIETPTSRPTSDSPRFSIVMPVYNMEAYLSASLDAVRDQSYADIELICVNDGSTDRSLTILENYAAVDHRITIVNQENQGLFVARKNGILASHGEYVLCMDSDDWLDLDACDSFDRLFREYPDTDILQYGVTPEGGKEERLAKQFYSQWFSLQDSEIVGREAMIARCYHEKAIPWNIATKVLRGSIARQAYQLIPDVRFGALEDFIGCFYVMNLSRVWRGMDNRHYHYRLGTGMSTGKLSSAYDAETFKQTLGYLEAYRNLKEWAEGNVPDSTIQAIVREDMMKVVAFEPYAYLMDRLHLDFIPEDFWEIIVEKVGPDNAAACLSFLSAHIFRQYQIAEHKRCKYKTLTNVLIGISSALLLVIVAYLLYICL